MPPPKKAAKTKQPTSSTILKQKALDVFQSQLSYLLGAQKTLTPNISLWPQHISPDYLGKPRFSNLEICTLLKKASPGRNERAINPSRGNGAPTTSRGDRQRRQGTALPGSCRRPSGSQSNPAQPALAVAEVGQWLRGASGRASELGLPGPGARQDMEVAPFSPAPAAATGPGPLPLASPPCHPQPASPPLTWQKLRQ